VLSGAALFVVSLLFGIRRGAIARLVQHRRFQHEWHERQFFRAVFEVMERTGFRRKRVRHSQVHKLSSRNYIRAFNSALRDGYVAFTHRTAYELTPTGWSHALEIVRGQRLWEAFLTEYPDQAGSIVNLASGSVAHVVSETTVALLTQKLQAAGRWPQAESAA